MGHRAVLTKVLNPSGNLSTLLFNRKLQQRTRERCNLGTHMFFDRRILLEI
jgi:hypothetical protein